MKRVLLAGAAAVLLLLPSAPLLAMAVVMNPAADASCLNLTSIIVGDAPNSLQATTARGEAITLDRTQLTHARTITQIGSQTEGVGHNGILIALMAALTESSLRMLANTSAYPESASYPNDGDGTDNDSLGLFQMRPRMGWGTVAELMDPVYQAQAFYGGPRGPNRGAPPGLLDIPNWERLTLGEAAQAVEVSAHPDRYANYEPVARTILSTLTVSGASSGVAETSRVVMPMAEGSYTITSGFGMRNDPLGPGQRMHYGLDFAAPDGTPILAVADGRVVAAGPSASGQNRIVVEHTIAGETVASLYLHSWDHGIHVTEGDQVLAGQHIADVGSQGRSTGPHLHLEIRPGGASAAAVDPEVWLASLGAGHLEVPGAGGPGCGSSMVGLPGVPAPFTGIPGGQVPDPTGAGGFVTREMAHLITETRAAFPDSSWSCWSPRPGTVSEHPLGRACDITFGNPIGVFPTPEQVAEGWRMTNWLQAHAEAMRVQYLIWQGHIWSVARDAEGWRPYGGGGMHDPADVTGGHYDHLHITTRE